MNTFLVLLLCFVTASRTSPANGLGALKDYDFEGLEFLPFEGRIVGGSVARPTQFPYQAGLYIISLTGTASWCGGSLISNKFVLTAAHCLERASRAMVILGAHNIQKENEKGRELYLVYRKDFIIHFAYSAYKNDIALIKLPNEIEFSDNIKPISLPSRNILQQNIEGLTATASGWGRTGDHSNISPMLLYVNLTISPLNSCQRYYPDTFDKSQICVSGSNRKSVCTGDSGGPIVLSSNGGSKVIVGLTSYGRRESCELGFPVSFTRITSYLDWISMYTGISVTN